MWTKHDRGPRIEPRGTPQTIGEGLQVALSTLKAKLRSLKKISSRSSRWPHAYASTEHIVSYAKHGGRKPSEIVPFWIRIREITVKNISLAPYLEHVAWLESLFVRTYQAFLTLIFMELSELTLVFH